MYNIKREASTALYFPRLYTHIRRCELQLPHIGIDRPGLDLHRGWGYSLDHGTGVAAGEDFFCLIRQMAYN